MQYKQSALGLQHRSLQSSTQHSLLLFEHTVQSLVFDIIVVQKYNFVVMVFCFHLPHYPHHISTAAADSTVVVAVSREEEEEGALMVDCCLLFSLLV